MGKLIVVDDDPNILETVEMMIEDDYPGTTYCLNVEEAKEKINSIKYDCLIIDIDIQGRNGAELINYIKKEQPQENHLSPFIIMSGFVDAEFNKKFGDKVDGTISKPFTADQLKSVIKNALQKKERSSETKNQESPKKGELDGVNLFDPDISKPFDSKDLDRTFKKIIKRLKGNSKFEKAVTSIKTQYQFNKIGKLINISCAIAKKMDWGSEKTLEKLIYASYLHDISLSEHLGFEEIQSLEEASHLSDSEKELILNHPIKSAEKAENIPNLPDEVVNLIKQHQENSRGTGFPNQIGHQSFQPLSALFNVSHELATHLVKNEKGSLKNFLNSYQHAVRGSHFKKVIRAVLDIT